MKLRLCIPFAAVCVLVSVMLSPAALAAADSADVVSAALGEVGYTEGEEEYSQYGEWYGLSNAYWCDMFVSWCAMRGDVPESCFPRESSCTAHMKLFTQMERYQNSAARCGSYIPQQGDVIFFYNYLNHPAGKICSHTGIVLYVENGYVYTIEGNALTNRLDCSYSEVAELRDDGLDPPDYVAVNRYPLDAPQIHGYGVPDYSSRTPLQLDGFVDLGRYSKNSGVYQYLCASGLMSATSTYTFSPRHGMTRGEFLALIMNFLGFSESGLTVSPFEDVPPDSPYYSAVMSARAAGLVTGADNNCFLPDIYIAPDDAQAIFDRVLEYLGLELQFSFSPGDYSYILTPYTIRADIAQALYMLCRCMPLSEGFEGQIIWGEETCPARCLNGVCYVPVQSLQQIIPGLELAEGAAQPVPAWDTDRVLPAAVTLWYEGEVAEVDGFAYRGTLYVSLRASIDFLPLDLEYSEEGNQSVVLMER